MRRPLALLAVLLGMLVPLACTDEGDSEAFCDRVAEVPQLGQVLAQLDVSDPGGVRRELEGTIDEFRALEADAPGAIRPDVARLREGVALVVEAVEANPGDLPAARRAIAARTDELAGLAQASRRVVDYADEECGITLDDVGGVTEPAPTPDPPATEPPATEPGG